MDFYKPPQSQLQAKVDNQGNVLADRVARLTAAVVDLCLVFILDLVLLYFIGRFFGDDIVNSIIAKAPEVPATILFSIMLIVFFCGLLIFTGLNIFLLRRHGQTIGKALMRIRIVDMQGQTLPWWHIVLKRFLPYWTILFIPFIGELLFIIDVLPVMLANRRCLHDLVAGTQVVSVSQK